MKTVPHRSVWLLVSATLSLAKNQQGAHAAAAAWSHRHPIAFLASSRRHHTVTRSLVGSLSLLSVVPVFRIHNRFSVEQSALFHSNTNDNVNIDIDNDNSSSNSNEENQKLKGPLVQPPRPNPNTYWVIPNKFLAGEYPGDKSGTPEATRQKLKAYLDLGVTCFFDLTEAGEKNEYESILMELAAAGDGVSNKNSSQVEYHRYSIPDFGIPSNPNLMTNLLEEMNQAMTERNQTVYVHCRGGIGRTGTTVGCYLKQYGHYNDGNEALDELNRLFQTSGRSLESSYSPETPDQIRYIKEWND